MQATITYLLTEQAQRAQMVATGQPVARRQVAIVEVSPEDFPLLDVADDGTLFLDLSDTASMDVADSLDVLSKIREEQAAAEAAKIAAQTKKLQEQAAAEAAKIAAKNKKLQQQADAAAAEEAKRIADDVKDKAKSDFIAAWIAQHADDQTREQFAEGLLSRAAALTLIADDLFSSHGIIPNADVPDTCRDSDCPCCDSSVETLPRRIYPRWRELKGKLPEGSTVRFSKVRECLRDEERYDDGETAGPVYYTANLTVPCGGLFQFECRVKLG